MGGGHPTTADYSAGYKHDLNWIPDANVVTLSPPVTAPSLSGTAASLAPAPLTAVASAGGALSAWAAGKPSASTMMTLVAEDSGFLPTNASSTSPATAPAAVTFRLPSYYASVSGGTWWTYGTLRGRVSWVDSALGLSGATGLSLQAVPFYSSSVGQSLMVDPAPLTTTQIDAVVPVGSAFVYDASPLVGARLLIEPLAEARQPAPATTAGAIAATLPGALNTLTLRLSFLGPGYERPAGAGCLPGATPAAGLCEPQSPAALVAATVPASALQPVAAVLANLSLTPLAPAAIVAITAPLDGSARAVSVTTCAAVPGGGSPIETRLAVWTEGFPAAEAITLAPLAAGAAAAVGWLNPMPGVTPVTMCATASFVLFPGAPPAYVVVTTWPRGGGPAVVALAANATVGITHGAAPVTSTAAVMRAAAASCPAASWASSANTCTGCGPYSMAPPDSTNGAAACGCAPGFYVVNTTLTALANPLATPAYSCVPCAAGTAKPWRANDPSLCITCPSGYTSAAGSDRCVAGASGGACPSGFVGSLPNCVACPLGAGTGGKTSATCACQPGWAINATATGTSLVCSVCPVGTYSSSWNATSCTPCAGAASALPGATACGGTACGNNFVPVFTGVATVCACPWGYTVSYPNGTCAPPLALSLTSASGALPPHVTGTYVLAVDDGSVAAAEAAAGCSGVSPYTGRTWLRAAGGGGSPAGTPALWFDGARQEWSIAYSSDGTVAGLAPGGPRVAYIPAGSVATAPSPVGLSPDPVMPIVQRISSDAVLPLGAAQPWAVFTGLTSRWATVTAGAIAVAVAVPPSTCGAGRPTPAATATPLATITASTSPAASPAASPKAGAAPLIAGLSLTVTESCLFFVEMIAQSPTGSLVLLPVTGAAASAALAQSSIRSGYPELFGPSSATDLLANPIAGEGVASPMVATGCSPREWWSATLPSPAAVASVYLVSRRDSGPECGGDCGSMIVAGNGTLIATLSSGTIAAGGVLQTTSVQYGYTMSLAPFVGAPTPAASDPWQLSAGAQLNGVRYIKVIAAVGQYLHFTEVSKTRLARAPRTTRLDEPWSRSQQQLPHTRPPD